MHIVIYIRLSNHSNVLIQCLVQVETFVQNEVQGKKINIILDLKVLSGPLGKYRIAYCILLFIYIYLF